MGPLLQIFRRTFAGSFFLLLLLYVGGAISTIAGFDPSIFSRIQFVPALLAGSFGVVALIILFTWIFGRWYCSFLCPLGVLQDILARLHKKKVKAGTTASSIIRFAILAACAASLFLGTTVVVLLVDPWSVFGRLTTTFILPVLTFVNNQLSAFFNYFGMYGVVAKEYNFAGASVLLVAAVSLSLLSYFLFVYGTRFWCNTLCPVGTILSVVARRSLVRVQIDPEKCVSCGLCEKHCKAGVITHKAHRVDCGDCVACFNCLPVCKYEAIFYNLQRKGKSL